MCKITKAFRIKMRYIILEKSNMLMLQTQFFFYGSSHWRFKLSYLSRGSGIPGVDHTIPPPQHSPLPHSPPLIPASRTLPSLAPHQPLPITWLPSSPRRASITPSACPPWPSHWASQSLTRSLPHRPLNRSI